jgi:hypothetical protein
MGNILFILGLTLIIGLQKTITFFARRQKLKGTAAFVSGIALILLRWTFIGFLVELYGIFILFGDFFSTIAGFAVNIPVVGPYLAVALRRAGEASGAQTQNSQLPV